MATFFMVRQAFSCSKTGKKDLKEAYSDPVRQALCAFDELFGKHLTLVNAKSLGELQPWPNAATALSSWPRKKLILTTDRVERHYRNKAARRASIAPVIVGMAFKSSVGF